MVRMRGWVIHNAYENPHEDRSTRIYVWVCVCIDSEPFLLLRPQSNSQAITHSTMSRTWKRMRQMEGKVQPSGKEKERWLIAAVKWKRTPRCWEMVRKEKSRWWWCWEQFFPWMCLLGQPACCLAHSCVVLNIYMLSFLPSQSVKGNLWVCLRPH